MKLDQALIPPPLSSVPTWPWNAAGSSSSIKARYSRTVALANKIARIAWALMTRKEVYQAQGRSIAAA